MANNKAMEYGITKKEDIKEINVKRKYKIEERIKADIESNENQKGKEKEEIIKQSNQKRNEKEMIVDEVDLNNEEVKEE